MKQILVVILLIFSVIQSKAQVETNYYAKNEANRNIFMYSRKNTIVHAMPLFDLEKMQKEDAEMEGEEVPYRFGKGFDVSFSFDDGQWEDVESGRLWTISFKSEGAISLNFIIDDFYLPEGAKLYIENQDETVLYGPVTSGVLPQKHDSFLTDIIPGEQSTIYLFEPLEKKGESKLTIKRVIHGYRGIVFDESYGTIGSSSPCNHDVACLPAYDKESNAVALVLLSNGDELCSGSLLMNTSLTFDPYFLTAFHCIDINPKDDYLSDYEKNKAENWMFKFQFKKASCNGNTITVSYTYNKADFCSAFHYTDFALMKIKGAVSQNLNLTWLGWDKSFITPSSTACIHHPAGDVMKISVDYDAASSYSDNGGTDNFWQVNFDYGITQGGSSGSPLLNIDKRVVGQLMGGPHPVDTCDWTLKRYGKFSHSWTGGGHSYDRISDWLDPNGLCLTTIEGSYPLYLSGPSSVCSSSTGTYTIYNLPSGYTVNWYFTNGNGSVAPAIMSSGNTCTITNNISQTYMGTLNADIYYNSTLLRTMRKENIIFYVGFYGLFSSGNVINQPFYPLSPIWVNKGDLIYLKSINMLNKNVSYSVTTPSTWQYYPFTGELYLTYPNINSNNPIYITIQSDPNHPTCDDTTYQIVIMPNDVLPHYLLSISVDDNGQIVASLVENECNNELKSVLDKDTNIRTRSDTWSLEVYNAVTSHKIFDKVVDEDTYTIDTMGWPSGIYIVKAIYGNESLSEKVRLK